MRNRLGARAVAATTTAALALVGIATAASAEDAAATLTLGKASVLTLPAADGVRDSTSVSVASDVATTADVALVPDEGEPLPLAPVEIADPAFPALVTVPVDGLAAGAYELVVTPAAGDPVVAPMTVGSGDPVDVSLTLSRAKLFTWSGASPRTAVATVSATDETGLKVPFTGKVVAKAGGRTSTVSVSSATGAAVKPTIYASKLAAGTGTVTAKLDGPTLVGSTASAPITIKKTAITGVSLATSRGDVYPAKDDYRDSVKLTVTPTTSRAASVTFPVTGSVKIKHDGRIVKTWSLTSSEKRSLKWYGKNGGRIVPGTYKVTVTLKGPEGSWRTATKYVKVKAGRLVTVTKKVTHTAASVLTSYTSHDPQRAGYCEPHHSRAGDVFCRGVASSSAYGFALSTSGTATVPADVASNAKWGRATAKVVADWASIDGSAQWFYGKSSTDTTRFGYVVKGSQSLGDIGLDANTTRLHIRVSLFPDTRVKVNTFTVTYSYRKLVL
ncbi:hypothetical protein [Demequina maris]|uniref:hypothetical protein n=1 Tax=Demequina maris TaxID=1638982 RepID=UPI00078643B4|nr:hypothetical protein [Demequina maris]